MTDHLSDGIITIDQCETAKRSDVRVVHRSGRLDTQLSQDLEHGDVENVDVAIFDLDRDTHDPAFFRPVLIVRGNALWGTDGDGVTSICTELADQSASVGSHEYRTESIAASDHLGVPRHRFKDPALMAGLSVKIG